MSYTNLNYNVENGLATITINRPDKLNALNALTVQEIGAAVKKAINQSEVRIIIITGSGEKSFVAGADISEFEGLNEEQSRALAQAGQDAFFVIENSPKPVIAAINGFALGGGCELAMACHLRVAAENARFGQPEVKLGLIPAYGGTQRLTKLIGKTKALELMITTDMINAAEALQMGLVNYVVPQAELMNKTRELASKIMKQAPLAVAGVIRCVNDFYKQVNGFQTEVEVFGQCFKTEDNKEGVAAFKEKRSPVFKGK
ncbi:MAG: enoyl-CoA hydratase/isomerase family protein [Bacteroidetes bacterium]|nr:enoyl-CoA hydratase/isomerase family protein [Bacteroidota bacterium]MBX7238394.1 enoyl-CoA hydratase/isomerase family protein [Bacteroidia bacterium]HMU77859.1 enoyl-CoA hydratase-related protein [Bacteroidia bacterium]HMW10946.1 enoyl-CoA hydratase-related protein [Bacteroidia bacterium]HMX97892.1 enoyl-CoA hydratase-related protein [Bacteroidia bacterium]